MRLVIGIFLSAFLFSSIAAYAEPASSEKQARAATKFRQSLFQLVRSNMGPLGGMARGQIPFDAAVMEKNGMRMEQLGLMMADYLAVDTRKYKVDTEALDKIWENHDEFGTRIQDFISATQNLQTVAKAGDESKFKAAIGGVGRTCKGCHDNFKAE